LAHDLGLPRAPEPFARLVGTGAVRRLDMGLVGERRFLLVVSAGFDAMVVREIARTRSATLGYWGYARPIFRALKGYVPPRITIEVDDRPAVEGQLVVVSNTRNYGGLFTMADRARCDSGHLDICVLLGATTWPTSPDRAFASVPTGPFPSRSTVISSVKRRWKSSFGRRMSPSSYRCPSAEPDVSDPTLVEIL
jgi:diacylglycerol kinase family enzyme